MIYHYVEQRSEAWHKLRLGKFTATDFQTVANGKKDTIRKLVYKKAAEQITGYREEGYMNDHMLRGVELEDEARKLYEFQTGNDVTLVGFVSDDWIGCSPDGLIGDDGGLEIKCKDIHTHLDCLLNGDNSYKWQIQGSLYVTQRLWWDFVSYNPHFPADKQLYIERWYPDEELQVKIERGLVTAVEMLQEVLEKYKEVE